MKFNITAVITALHSAFHCTAEIALRYNHFNRTKTYGEFKP